MYIATFSNKSLWYRLATKYGNLDEDLHKTDICTYASAVINGILGVLLIILIISVMGVLFGVPLLWLLCSIQFGFIFELDSMVLVGFIVWGIFGLMMIFAYGYTRYTEYRRSHTKTQSDSFLKKRWMAFKHKVCFTVNIEGNVPWQDTIDNIIYVIMHTGESFKFFKPAGQQLPSRLLQLADYVHNDTTHTELKSAWEHGSEEYTIGRQTAILSNAWVKWDDIIKQYGNQNQ